MPLDSRRRAMRLGGEQQEERKMKKVEVKNVKPYQAPKHFNMVALKLHGKEETDSQKFWMGLSHFLPGGGAELDASPVEKVYFVLEGQVTVITGSKEKVVLSKWDSIHIGAGEEREIINETNSPASMLVVINYPDAAAPQKG
jgi:quercetin dioxygenase-like cupin family protein